MTCVFGSSSYALKVRPENSLGWSEAEAQGSIKKMRQALKARRNIAGGR